MAKRTRNSPVRIGLMGAGLMGSTHAAAYANIPDAQLCGVWDADTSRARQLADAQDVRVYASRDELLADVDAVDICLPTPFHLENIQAAAAKKKAVLCEKPLGRTLEQCDAAIAACKKAGVRLLVGHVVRFFPEYNALRSALLNGKIGEPAVLRLRRVVCAPGPKGSWYWNFEASGGCVFDTAIHDLDWLLYTLGRPKTIYGAGRRDADALQDLALVTLTWDDGVIAHLESSWCHAQFSTSFEASGSNGLIEYDLEDSAPLKVALTSGGGSTSGNVVPESPLATSPYQAELAHFVEVLMGRAKPLITPAQAREAVELAGACLEAVALREVVRFPRPRKALPVPKKATRRRAGLGAEHPE